MWGKISEDSPHPTYLNDYRNGFFSINRRHDGTHTDEYIMVMLDRLRKVKGKSPQEVTDVLTGLMNDALAGKF